MNRTLRWPGFPQTPPMTVLAKPFAILGILNPWHPPPSSSTGILASHVDACRSHVSSTMS